MIAFGPIPSRRLGQSLGINNIPPKSCSFDCIYCQVGPTRQTEIERRPFYHPDEVFLAVRQKAIELQAADHRIDYLTFVPDGEPTLDINLGETIEQLGELGFKIAVITNASLLWRADVRKDLARADLVSLKLDSVVESDWRAINRPSAELSLSDILEGTLKFAREYKGALITETMLAQGINDSKASLTATAKFLGQVDPEMAYIAIPTRPPSEGWVKKPGEPVLNFAYQVFNAHVQKAEILTGFSEEDYSATGDVVQGLLGITSVHPMRESEAIAFLEEGQVEKTVLDTLVEERKLVRVVHDGETFYVRKLSF